MATSTIKKQVSLTDVNNAIQQSAAMNSWTPVDTSLTLSSNTGQYIKIGNLVYVRAEFSIAQAIGANGVIQLRGLPSNVAPQTNYQSLGMAACLNIGITLYCRLFDGIIYIYNFTGQTINGGSMYIVNAVYCRQ